MKFKEKAKEVLLGTCDLFENVSILNAVGENSWPVMVNDKNNMPQLRIIQQYPMHKDTLGVMGSMGYPKMLEETREYYANNKNMDITEITDKLKEIYLDTSLSVEERTEKTNKYISQLIKDGWSFSNNQDEFEDR